MGSHPLNLALRFLLELAALAVAGIFGWTVADGWWRLVAAIDFPLTLAVLWGVFAVPGDPSRSGKAIVPIPGILRLLLELVIFGFAAWALFSMDATRLSLLLGGLTILHYALSWDRVAWLRQEPSRRHR